MAPVNSIENLSNYLYVKFMVDLRKKLGDKAEKLAAQYLKRKGYKIIDQNVRNFLGEIDLVARKDGAIVFVEVKASHSVQGFYPYDHFDLKKKKKLLQLSKIYLDKFRGEHDVRFDLVTVTKHIQNCGTRNDVQIDHFENVIQDSFK